ncbi:MAG: hypothetical protein OES09_00415 [Gammaproteobacteria bacterium]|nr:hypothetical protein [Gammaproteobacteria bacterium]
MSTRVIYIGDLVTARGLALVGVEVHIVEPEPRAVLQALASARRSADLVILNQQHAAAISTGQMLHESLVPPMVILPSIDGQETVQDRVIGPARQALGLA